MSRTEIVFRGVAMFVLFLAVVALAFTYAESVDSAPGQPTPVLDLFNYLPFIPNAPTPTPTPRPTITPIPTLRPTPPTAEENSNEVF